MAGSNPGYGRFFNLNSARIIPYRTFISKKYRLFTKTWNIQNNFG